MKLTKLRNKDGSKLESIQFDLIESKLNHALYKAGFITDITMVNSSQIKIGQRMRTFSIDVSRLGYNTQMNPYQKRRTNLPCWKQRVEFNMIVNAVLDSLKISCNIKSGPFVIREGMLKFDEYDWSDQKPIWMYENERKGYRIEAGDYKERA